MQRSVTAEAESAAAVTAETAAGRQKQQRPWQQQQLEPMPRWGVHAPCSYQLHCSSSFGIVVRAVVIDGHDNKSAERVWVT